MLRHDVTWNKSYASDRDYLAIATADLTLVLNRLNKAAPQVAIDIGCGTGQVRRDLYHRGFSILGIDASRQALQLAQSSTVYCGTGINFIEGDALTFDYPENSAGLIMCKYTYVFLKHRSKFLMKTKLALNSRGMLVIISPDQRKMTDQKLHIAFDHEQLLGELKTVYSRVESICRNRDIYYFCTK